MKSYCVQCLKPFEAVNAGQEFCTVQHRDEFHRDVKREEAQKRRAVRETRRWTGITGQVPNRGLAEGRDRDDYYQ